MRTLLYPLSSYLINFTLVASRGLALGGWMIMPIYFLIYSEGVMPNIEGVIKSLDLHLTSEDIRYLEEPYAPHNLSGVMAVNKPTMSEEPVWVAASKNK